MFDRTKTFGFGGRGSVSRRSLLSRRRKDFNRYLVLEKLQDRLVAAVDSTVYTWPTDGSAPTSKSIQLPGTGTVTRADVNGDDLQDLIWSSFRNHAGDAAFALSNEAGFGSWQTFIDWRGAYDFSGYTLQSGDVNGDQLDDVVYSRFLNGVAEVSYMLSTGTGFGRSINVVDWRGYDYSKGSLTLANVNSDEKVDLVFTRFMNTVGDAAFALSNGTGFGSWQTFIEWRGPYDFSDYKLQAGDVNGDHRDDVVYSRFLNGVADVSFMLSTGNGFGQSTNVLDLRGGDYSKASALLTNVHTADRTELVFSNLVTTPLPPRIDWGARMNDLLRDLTPGTLFGHSRNSVATSVFSYDPVLDRVTFSTTVKWRIKIFGHTISSISMTTEGWVDLRNPSASGFRIGRIIYSDPSWSTAYVANGVVSFFRLNADLIRRSF